MASVRVLALRLVRDTWLTAVPVGHRSLPQLSCEDDTPSAIRWLRLHGRVLVPSWGQRRQGSLDGRHQKAIVSGSGEPLYRLACSNDNEDSR